MKGWITKNGVGLRSIRYCWKQYQAGHDVDYVYFE